MLSKWLFLAICFWDLRYRAIGKAGGRCSSVAPTPVQGRLHAAWFASFLLTEINPHRKITARLPVHKSQLFLLAQFSHVSVCPSTGCVTILSRFVNRETGDPDTARSPLSHVGVCGCSLYRAYREGERRSRNHLCSHREIHIHNDE